MCKGGVLVFADKTGAFVKKGGVLTLLHTVMLVESLMEPLNKYKNVPFDSFYPRTWLLKLPYCIDWPKMTFDPSNAFWSDALPHGSSYQIK